MGLHAVYRAVESWKCAKGEMLVLKMLLRCGIKKPLIIRQTQSVDVPTRKGRKTGRKTIIYPRTKQKL